MHDSRPDEGCGEGASKAAGRSLSESIRDCEIDYVEGGKVQSNAIEATDESCVSCAWLSVLRGYLLVLAGANLIWEFAHMPLYTLWREGTASEIVFAALHCTGGDIIIAGTALVLALTLFGRPGWPDKGYLRVAGFAVLFGLVYTAFSEWLNIVIRQAWQYSELMPVIPILDMGLSPFAQWIVIPIVAFAVARHNARR